MIKRFKFLEANIGTQVGGAVTDATQTTGAHVEQGIDQIHEGANHVEQAIGELTDIVKGLAEHTKALTEYTLRVHPIEAVEEVPSAASDVVEGAGVAGGETLEGAADVVASPAKVLERKRRKGLRRK